jgi:hypothetical protein
VPPAAIVAVLAPVGMAPALDATFIANHRVRFVGSTKRAVYFAGTHEPVEIVAPDYQSALRRIFELNPDKTLVTHTTRLGVPNPIEPETGGGGRPEDIT